MMKTTVIFTVTQTLTINTSEQLKLEKMGPMGRPVPVRDLVRGPNKVPVEDGVYRILSKQDVTVTAPTQDPTQFHVMNLSDSKDGDPPDAPRMVFQFDKAAFGTFIEMARNRRAPT